jgi:hypothetical protein
MRERLTAMIESARYFGSGISAEIADLLLENGVIVPPCKVGDTVYEIQPIRQRIQAYDVTTVKYNGKFYWFTWVLKDRRGHYGNVEGFSDIQIGKTVFLTREEAQKALKGGE